MKWIRRKPSLRVRLLVVIVCLLYLLTLPYWAGRLSPGFGETESRWNILVEPVENPPVSGPEPLASWTTIEQFRTIIREGRVIVVAKGEDGYMAIDNDPESLWWAYISGSYQTGFWAPTWSYSAKEMRNPQLMFGRNATQGVALQRQRMAQMRAELIAQRGLDSNLMYIMASGEGHQIWTGKVFNTLSVLALLLLAWAFFWSLVWVPVAIRQRTQRGRLAMGLCPKCTYDLSGTPGSCPECGWVLDEARTD